MDVSIVEPDPNWPAVFEELATTIRAAASAATVAEGGHVMDYNSRKEEAVLAIHDRIFRSRGWR